MDKIKVDKEDVNAIANSRFFRKTGIKLLMALAIIMLFFAMITTTFKIIPPIVYYVIIGVSGILIMWRYAKGQQKMRKEVWEGVNKAGIEPKAEMKR